MVVRPVQVLARVVDQIRLAAHMFQAGVQFSRCRVLAPDADRSALNARGDEDRRTRIVSQCGLRGDDDADDVALRRRDRAVALHRDAACAIFGIEGGRVERQRLVGM